MGPLTTMYGMAKKRGDDDFSRFRQSHPGWNNDDYSRALFNIRLSKMSRDFPGGRLPEDDGGPIILDSQNPSGSVPPEFVLPFQNIGPTGGIGPRAFRDPEQAGPSPPPGNGPLASMFRR